MISTCCKNILTQITLQDLTLEVNFEASDALSCACDFPGLPSFKILLLGLDAKQNLGQSAVQGDSIEIMLM